MTHHAWRIVKAKHSARAFSGEGAEQHGGRWNSPGNGVVYAAGSVSLAMLEMLVHLQRDELLRSYALFEITFDTALVRSVDTKTLPTNWRRYPPIAAIKSIGDAWLAEARSPILRVPSALVPTESNYLINPAHPDVRRITIGPKQAVRFDPRLAKR
jgi:RES domain-containing protein